MEMKTRKYHRWNLKEDKILRDYPDGPMQLLCELLPDRDKRSIEYRRSKIGLTETHPMNCNDPLRNILRMQKRFRGAVRG